MSWFTTVFSSSIGKKYLMGFTGLFLCSFLVVHLVGNFQLFYNDNGEAFNAYTKFMTTNGIIRFLEIGLVLGFLGHIISGFMVTAQNWKAKPIKYAVNAGSQTSSFSSRTMIWTGSLVLIFLVIHLKGLWFEYKFGPQPADMYQITKDVLSEPIYSSFYIVSMIIMAIHLKHGFESAFQTFGLKDKRYEPLVKGAEVVFWALIPIGFALIPLYFVLGGAN